MMECEYCGEHVERTLRYRDYGVTMTHRVTRWLCSDCHPTAPTRSAGPEREEPSETIVADGGTATACPRCASSTINVQGLRDCTGCGWRSY